MKFRTEIAIPSGEFSLSHSDKILMIGSCFVENLSEKLIRSGFQVCVNPSGIMYNPVSIRLTLEDILQKRRFDDSDLFVHQGVYHSFFHHSRFSGTEPDKVLATMNASVEEAHAFLKEAMLLVITLGTAHVYYSTEDHCPVSNCHKLPSQHFVAKRLAPEAIVREWNGLLVRLREINPALKILFTISPIRHWKDGAHDNQVSKSILFVAVDELMKQQAPTYYFPSYEIVMDDLRDYRFYAEDMLHPNAQAIDYIWDKFQCAYFTDKTRALIREWESIRQALAHRPFNPDSNEYKVFLQKMKDREADFLQRNPEFQAGKAIDPAL